MSRVSIIKALEGGLRTVPNLLPTVYENETSAAIDTSADATYQKANTLFARAITNEQGKAKREHGYYQITMCFPYGQGIGPPMAESERIEAILGRTESFEADGIVVNIEAVQVLAHRPGKTHDEMPVLIHFWAHVP